MVKKTWMVQFVRDLVNGEILKGYAQYRCAWTFNYLDT